MLNDSFASIEPMTAQFGSLEEAEAVAARLQQIGVAPEKIVMREGGSVPAHEQPKTHLGQGILLGIGLGAILGGLFGAIFAQPTQSLTLLGSTYSGEIAGAISGFGYGLLYGMILGVIVGLLSRNSAASPIRDFDELFVDSVCIEAQVPVTLVGQARMILNAG